MNIDQMQAGREMDALVAEKAMGISVQLFGDPCYLVNYCLRKDNGDLYYFKGECPLKASREEVKELIPNYSTDIARAWEVVEKMKNYLFVCGRTDDGIWEAYFFPVNSGIGKLSEAHGDTAPSAICRAALKAMGVTEC